MKIKINLLFIYAFFALLTFTACQDEAIDINNPEEQEMIQPNTALASFMSNVTANYGENDNILDESSCFSIELPVTIIVGDVTIVIETLSDLEALEDLFAQYENEDDFFDFVFPFTIIFNDYTEVIIENEEQLQDFIEDCEIEDDEVIECVDFVYPISFSVFNANFNIVDTVTIANDEALYNFLEELEDDDNALIVSLNYPVTLVYANGNTIEVNSNQELSDAIAAAEEDCDGDYEECDINLEGLENLLLECGFEAEFYNAGGELEDSLQLHFDESGSVTVTGDPTVVETGNWNVIETDLGYKLVIEGLETFGIANGLWLLTDCDDNEELEFKKETDNGFITMKLELDCEGNLDCDALEIATNLKECKWWIGTDLLSPNYNGPLNFHEGGTVTIGNNEELTGTWEVLVGNTGIFLILDLPGDYEILSFDWRIVVCEDDRLELVADDNALVLEQGCDVEPDCNQSDVSDYLMSCYIVPTVNDYTSPLTYFQFSENNSLFTMYQGDLPHWGTWDISTDDNGVFIFIDFSPFIDQYYNGQWYLEECNDNGLVFSQGDNVLILACDENVSSAFDCFEDREVVVCDDDIEDGFTDFDLYAIYDCPEDNVNWTFHTSIADAEASLNSLVSPFENTANPQILYTRVELAGNPSTFEIFEVELIVENCNPSGCSEEDVDGFLTSCIWNAVNYNGSDNLLNWNFDFEPNSQNVVIYNNESTIDATWTTSQSEDGVIVTFSNVAGPNIQAITGEWLVVECEEDRLQLHRGDDILVLERTCE